MRLQLRKILHENLKLRRYFGVIDDDLILTNVTVDTKDLEKEYFIGSLFHWRLDDNENFPIDVSFESNTGRLMELNFYVDRSVLFERGAVETKLLVSLNEIEGYLFNTHLPVFDTTMIRDGEYYYDQSGGVNLFMNDCDLYCLFAYRKQSAFLEVNDGLQVFFDEEGDLSGFVLRELSRNELGLLVNNQNGKSN